jgi:hypothetical protein
LTYPHDVDLSLPEDGVLLYFLTGIVALSLQWHHDRGKLTVADFDALNMLDGIVQRWVFQVMDH